MLPSLVVLDISHSHISEAQIHLFGPSPHIEVINFSYNRLSRLLDGMFYLMVNIRIMDLSYNSIMGIDDSTLVGIKHHSSGLKLQQLQENTKLGTEKTKICDNINPGWKSVH